MLLPHLSLFAQADQQPFNIMWVALPVAAILFIFVVWLPENRKRKEVEKRLSELKKNDLVVTSAGMIGIVVNASPDSKIITIRVDDGNNTKIRILRSSVSHIGEIPEESEEKKEAS